MLQNLHSLLALGCILLAGYGFGRPVINGLRLREDGPIERIAWALGTGLTLAGSLLAVIGLLGWLNETLVGLFTLFGCLAGTWALYLDLLSINSPTDEDEPLGGSFSKTDGYPVDDGVLGWSPPARWLIGGLLALAALAALGSLISALAPPTAGDALCYHLELPKVFLAEGGIRFLPYHDGSTYPLLTEMWYAWALALDGPVAAQLVHWATGLLLALATVVLGQEVLGRGWARVAGLLVLTVPGITNQMTAPLNDLSLAFLGTLAVAAWYRGAVDGRSSRWFVVAGLMIGGALATKYLALLAAMAIAGVWCWHAWRRPHFRELLWRGGLTMAVVGASLAGPWYVRAAWHRGNPVYPFLSEVFPVRAQAAAFDAPDGDASARDSSDSAVPAADGAAATTARPTIRQSKRPLTCHPWHLMTAAWQITMTPERFGGRAHQLGILPLALLPGLLLCRRLRGLGTLLAIAALYTAAWFMLRQNARFLLPVVPPVLVAVAWVIQEMRHWAPAPRAVLGLVLAGVLTTLALVPLERCSEAVQVAAGLESRDDYLVRNEASYRAAAVANCLLPNDARLLSLDYRTFYFQCPTVRENVLRRYTGYDHPSPAAHPSGANDSAATPGTVTRRLRELGFTHLLLVENRAERGIQFDPTLPRLLDQETRTSGRRAEARLPRPLVEYDFRDRDGAVRHYRLVSLPDGRTQR